MREKGYYCVATVPLTSLSGPEGVGSGKEVEFNQESNHAKFTGKVYFHNKFEGNLPASEYPKLNVSQAPFLLEFLRLESSGQSKSIRIKQKAGLF